MTTHPPFDEAKVRRDGDGKFAPKGPAAEETGVELGDGFDPGEPATWTEEQENGLNERGRAVMDALRASKMDPTTGAVEPNVYRWTWTADDDSGDFEAGSQDLANIPARHWNYQSTEDLAVRQACLEAELAADPDRDVESITAAAYDRAGVLPWAQSPEEERAPWREHAEAMVNGTGPAPAIASEVAEHEADGGVIAVERDSGEATYVHWYGNADPDSTFHFRKPAEGEHDAPVVFEDGTPTVWARGRDRTRAIHSDGSKVWYHPNGVVSREERADGSVYHFDENWERHRDDGPSDTDEDGQHWFNHGVLDRDPVDGPAALRWDGEVRYVIGGVDVDPTPEQAERDGVEDYGDSDRWPTDMNVPGRPDLTPAKGRWRVIGSDPDGVEPEAFDWRSAKVYRQP